MPSRKLKIAIVVQRYGLEVAGGAELHARWLSEHLSKYFDIEVITTKAIDYVTWKNEYREKEETINGVKILRFGVDAQRNIVAFNTFSEKIFGKQHRSEDEVEWVRRQGPYSTEMFEYIKSSESLYDGFIFFQYLYAPTVFGLPLVKGKSILIPTAHSEPPIYLKVFRELLKKPAAIMPSTPEEAALIKDLTYNKNPPIQIAGVGINVPPAYQINAPQAIRKFKLKNKYILYMGRIEAGKGCHELFENFQRLKNEITNLNIDLVLVGKAIMDIPKRSDIRFLGFVTEEDKFSLIKGCEFIVNPSQFESLSMIIMEAWLLRKSVLVNGRCSVLKGQCQRSNGGLWYSNYEEFSELVRWMLSHENERKEMATNGKRYVELNYSWKIVEEKFNRFVPKILHQNR